MVKNKAIQEKWMKEYFIQATKDILKGEGLKSISVRNIAEKAGYSYATMYNYFVDVNELIFLCVADFQEECRQFVFSRTKKSQHGIEKLKSIVMAYLGYFVEYPGIFDLFYLAKVGDFGAKQTTIDLIGSSLDKISEAEWNYCLSRKLVQIEQVELIKAQLKYAVIGMLLLYLNRRIPASYSEFINAANVLTDTILGLNVTKKQGSLNTQNESPIVQNSLITVNLK